MLGSPIPRLLSFEDGLQTSQPSSVLASRSPEHSSQPARRVDLTQRSQFSNHCGSPSSNYNADQPSLVAPVSNFNGVRASMIVFEHHYFQISPTVIDYRGHHRTVFPFREINLKACALCNLRLDYSAGPGIEPRSVHLKGVYTMMYAVHVRRTGVRRTCIIV